MNNVSTGWYEKRDHRSHLIYSWDRTKEPLIIFSQDLRKYKAFHASAITLANIVARFMPQATFVVPSELYAYGTNGKTTLADAILNTTKLADSTGTYKMIDQPPKTWENGPVISIGPINTDLNSTMFMPGTGSTIIIPHGQKVIEKQPFDIIGALLTACMAAREIFLDTSNLINLRVEQTYEFKVRSPKHSKTITCDLKFGTMQLIGVGGIGSNIVYMLPFLNAKGIVHLIDHDKIDFTNLNRCLLFSQENAEKRAFKVEVAHEYLSRHSIESREFPMKYSEYVRCTGRGKPDIVLMMANEDQIWNSLQNNYPPIVFSSATSQNWGVQSSRHIPLEDSCISCLMGLHNQTEARLACDEGTIQTPTGIENGVLPFFAPLGAVLTISHILDEMIPGKINHENLRFTNLKIRYPRIQSLKLSSRPNCLCSSQDRVLYRAILANQ